MLHILITDTITSEEILSHNIKNIHAVITTDDDQTGVLEIGEFSGHQIITAICAFEKMADDHYKSEPMLRYLVNAAREDIKMMLSGKGSNESQFDAILRGFMSEDKP